MYDYELMKLVGVILLPEGNEPTAFQFINGFGLLLIAANNGKIYFVHIKQNDTKYPVFLHAIINLAYSIEESEIDSVNEVN
jgi:hypothetical protein